MNLRSALLLVLGLAVGFVGAPRGAGEENARAEAHSLLLLQFLPPRAGPAAATARMSAIAGVTDPGYNASVGRNSDGSYSASAPAGQSSINSARAVVEPSEDRVSKFFRTGVLVGDRPDDPAKKLSVGPCEGGQLLNLRSAF